MGTLGPLLIFYEIIDTCDCGVIYPVYMEQNYLDSFNLDCNLDYYLDRDPEEAPIYMRHSLFNITKTITIAFIVKSLFDGPEMAIHPM